MGTVFEDMGAVFRVMGSVFEDRAQSSESSDRHAVQCTLGNSTTCTDAQRKKMGTDALNVYALAKRLVKKPGDEWLVPVVAEMQQARGRKKPRQRKQTTPTPTTSASEGVDTTSRGSDREPCPSCGARLGGRSGCQRAFEELQALSSTSLARSSVHNLLIDTYAMQHTEEYGRSAKSYIAHLTALCCSVEAPGDQKLYWGIARWLNGPTTLTRPPDIATRGAMTIAGAQAVESDADYTDVVRRWARDVWAAYADQHKMARQWLHEVRLYLASARVPRR